MPRVQGLDTDRRRRPNRGIFSLATPFNQQQQHQQHQHSAAASASPNSSPHHHRRNANRNRNGDAYDDFDNDGDLEFHGTQTQQHLIVSTKKKQPSPFATFEFATKESHHAHENNVSSKASSAKPASMTAHSSDGSSSKNISKIMAGDESTSAIRNGSTSNNNNINDTKSTRDQTIMNRPDQFKDGVENDNNEDSNDDSDATTLDGSIDLLADVCFNHSSSKGANKFKNKKKNTMGGIQDMKVTTVVPGDTSLAAGLSPISPATQTLNRLSRFGSQEGGAELCIHLLKPITDTRTGASVAARQSNDKEVGGTNNGGNESIDELATRFSQSSNNSSSTKLPSTKAATNDNTKECLQNLKQYFMSTKNSSTYAQEHANTIKPPCVPFCHKCNRESNPALLQQSQQSASSSFALPHHGLCPKHPDFYNAGSYEILNIVVDGNLSKCEACMYHFEKGRKNKQLCHGNGCKWGARKKSRKGGSNQQHQSLSQKRKHAAPAKSTEKVSSPMPTRFSRGTSTRPRTPQGNNKTTSSNSQGSIGTSKQSAAAAAMTDQGPFEVGSLVFIQDRSGPGCNDVGGVAKVIHVHEPTESSARLYDVYYVIEHRRMRGIEEKYVTLHTDYVSPMKDTGANDESEEVENIQVNENNADVAGNANDEPDNQANETANVDEQEVGEDGHPLSDYERLRLRNIQRNNARLEQLGLIHEDNKLKPAKDSLDRSSTMKQKKKKQQQPSEDQWLERRTRPKRQTSQRSEEDGVGEKPKSTALSTANAIIKATATLQDAAKSGCKKCIDELKTGQKTAKNHDSNCPRKKSKSGQGKNGTGVKAAEPAQESTHLPTEFGNTSKAKASRMEAAKAGCKKCTLEWQTDKTDPTVNHDICCPRAQKKTPPQTQPEDSDSISTETNPASTLVISTHSYRVRQPTPSPVFGRNNNGYPPQLPAWINEFIDESNRHNETVPAPRGSKWLPCPNPWGKIGHEEGDFVVISPFQSESEADMLSIFHQGPNGSMPKRFVANPFEAGSPYHASHKSPARGEGYSVLTLTRDSSGLKPWGFTVRMHEFGGACLVDSVEPLSSAEAAKDISGWSNDCNDSSKAGLKLHDMLICINGKSVGSMTMPELQIELDVCGPALMLVVSRFEIQENESNNQGQCATLEDIAMDWNDIGAGCDNARKRKRVSFEEESSKENNEVKVYTNMNNDETEESQLWNCNNNEKYEESRDHSQNELQKPSIIIKGRKSTTLPSSNKSAQVNVSLGLKASRSQASKPGYEKGQTDPNDTNPDDSSCHGGKKLEKGATSGKEKDKPKKNAIEVCKQSIQNRHTFEKERKHAERTHKASKATHLKSTAGAKIKSRCQKQFEDLSDDESDIVPKRAPAKKNKAVSSSTIAQAQKSHDSACSSDVDECEGAEDDENPWLGCVCGKTHPHPIKVFWIQCEGCDAWNNVAQECVGFDANVAEKLEDWCCWTCDPPVAGLGL